MSKHSHPRRRKRRLLLLAAVLFLCAGFFYWSNHSLQVDIFTYTDPDLPAGFDGLKIVQLSDLHGAVFGDDNADLLSAVEAAEPDLIVLTGDLQDRFRNTPPEYTCPWARPAPPSPPPTLSPATTSGRWGACRS